jgi:hypothetical protein
MRVALAAAYVTLWAIVTIGIVYFAVRAGYPLWAGVICAYFLFVFLNGTLAYKARARQLKLQGKDPPRYLRYLFLPSGLPKLKDEAPRSTHIVVGLVAAIAGVFFVFCGAALALDAEWSRIPNPILVAAICLVPASIGGVFLYLAWRILISARRSTNVA